MYKSRLDFGVIFLSMLVGIPALIGGIYFLTHPEILIKKKHSSATMPPALLGLLLFILVFAALYPVIKKAAIVIIDEKTIRLRYFLKRINIDASEIRSVQLTARKWAGIFESSSNLTGIEIILINGKSYFLPDRYIESISGLKQHLASFCNDPGHRIEILDPERKKRKTSVNLGMYDEERFSGNYFTSFYGIMLIGIICLFGSIPLVSAVPVNWFTYYFIPGLIIIMYSAASIQANYFMISGNHLHVKNHLFFWKNKQYVIDDIQEAFFEETYRSSNSLRLVFMNYHTTNKFYAGSLRKKHWKALSERLNDLGIPVRSDFALD